MKTKGPNASKLFLLLAALFAVLLILISVFIDVGFIANKWAGVLCVALILIAMTLVGAAWFLTEERAKKQPQNEPSSDDGDERPREI